MSKGKPDTRGNGSAAPMSSKSLMQVVSSSEDEDEIMKTPPAKAPNNESESEDGEIDEEMDRNEERARMDAIVEEGLASGGRDVMQKDARYYMMNNVVCNNCGTKGHLSYDCTEKATSIRCYLCGSTGHAARDCPDEVCHYCKRSGHKLRDCPERSGGRGVRKRRPEKRQIGYSRPPKLSCYVCGETGHLDCGLAKIPKALLSCYNCGMSGHAGGGCNMTSVDRVIPIVLEMERERKRAKQLSGRDGKKKGDKGVKGDKGEKLDKVDMENERALAIRRMTPKEYRTAFLERARQRRYGRGNSRQG